MPGLQIIIICSVFVIKAQKPKLNQFANILLLVAGCIGTTLGLLKLFDTPVHIMSVIQLLVGIASCILAIIFFINDRKHP